MAKSIRQTSNMGRPMVTNISGETVHDATFDVELEFDFMPVDTVVCVCTESGFNLGIAFVALKRVGRVNRHLSKAS